MSIPPVTSQPVHLPLTPASPLKQAEPRTVPAYVTHTVDAQVGLPVIEVVNQEGTVTQSFPSQKQLEAYANGTEQPPAATVSSIA